MSNHISQGITRVFLTRTQYSCRKNSLAVF